MKTEIYTRNGLKEVNLNRRSAIRAKCMDCSGFDFSDVLNCHCKDCQLYDFRMGKGKQDARTRSKSIKAYCMWCMLDNIKEIARCTSVNCPLFNFRGGLIEKTSPGHDLEGKLLQKVSEYHSNIDSGSYAPPVNNNLI